MEPDLTHRPRTKRKFSDADVTRMRDLYYDRDVPMLQVADAFGVPVSTFLRWMSEMGWPRRSSSGPGNRPVYEYPDETPPTVTPPPALRATSPASDVAVAKHRQRSAGEDHRPPAPISNKDLAASVRAAAERDLKSLGALDPGTGMLVRKRRADIIESLARSIARIDRVTELGGDRKALAAREKTFETERAEWQRERASLTYQVRKARRELAEHLEEALAQAAEAAKAERAARSKPRPGKLTLPENEQWWIDRGVEPP